MKNETQITALMKFISPLSVNTDQATRLRTIGAEHRIGKNWQDKTGWHAPEQRAEEAARIIAEKPIAPMPIVNIIHATHIGSDPGPGGRGSVQYYEITFALNGEPRKARLADLAREARGEGFSRGETDPVAVEIYRQALIYAQAKDDALMGEWITTLGPRTLG